MKRVIKIEGMMCNHCTAHVEKALNAIDGVTATVSLENACAYVECGENITDEALFNAVTGEGYTVKGIEKSV